MSHNEKPIIIALSTDQAETLRQVLEIEIDRLVVRLNQEKSDPDTQWPDANYFIKLLQPIYEDIVEGGSVIDES